MNCKKYGYYGGVISHTSLKKHPKQVVNFIETTENTAKNGIIQGFSLLDRGVNYTLSFGGYGFL